MKVKRTCLLLPCKKNEIHQEQLCLPLKSSIHIDEYLRKVDSVVHGVKELISKGEYLVSSNCDDDDLYPYHNNARSIIQEKVLNICQREVGHTIPCQNDVIVSDGATTCIILALHSSSSSASHLDKHKKKPLSSLAHVDKPSCDSESCIRSMIQAHIKYHPHAQKVDMKIHIVGGFDDDDGCSRFISQFLIRLLAEIAQEHSAYLRMTLHSCLVSCLNDSGGLPIARGLAMNTTTGEAFLASVHSSALGPEIPLRCCRIFQSPSDSTLSVIHTYNNKRNNNSIKSSSSVIHISPFSFRPNLDTLDYLLQLPDSILLQYTSTSPHVEKRDFCGDFRIIAKYMKTHSCKDIFDTHCNRPVVLERKLNNFNMYEWMRI